MFKQICKKCKIEKELKEFYFRKEVGEYRKVCKKCYLINCDEYRKNNPEKEKLRHSKYMNKQGIKEKNSIRKKEWKTKNKEIIQIKDKLYREKNKDKIKEWHKQNYIENKESIKKVIKIYLLNNKDKRNEYMRKYQKEQKNNNPDFKIKSYISSRFIRDLKLKNIEKNDKLFSYTGYKYSDYINHFKKDILWNDYCSKKNLHIDHIIPVSAYDFTDKEEIKKCWHPDNLRLLPAKENHEKHKKIDLELIKKYNIKHLLPKGLKL